MPGTLTVSPLTITLAGIGAANAQPIAVSETGFAGNFGETDTCAGVATLSTASAKGPSTTYTVTGITAGTCKATFTDASAQSKVVNISVTTNGFVIESHAESHAQSSVH